MKSTLLTVFMLFALCCISFSQTGILDNSFGTNGIVITNIGLNTPDRVHGLLIQPDDKIVLAGSLDYGAESFSDFAIARYSLGGNLDSSFGINGKIITDVNSSENQCYAIGLQADGKIVAAGNYLNISTAPSNYDILLIRYKTNGQIDSSFGQNGKVIVSTPSYNDFIYSLVIQKDGKIVIGGRRDGQDSLTGQSQGYFELMRFDENGSIDSIFGNNGILVTTRLYFSTITSLQIQPDNKIVACGYGLGKNGSSDFALARYYSDGELDSSFGTGGLVTTDLSVNNSSIAYDYAYDVALQSDGKLVLVGETQNIDTGPARALAIARYSPNGKLDKTFNKTGIVKGDFYNEVSSGNSIAIEKDDKILVSGFAIDSGRASFLVARYKQNGSPDSTFGTNGFTITHFGSDVAEPSAIGFQSDGKIIVGGTDYYSYNGDFALARYNNDAILPVNFISFDAARKDQSVLLNWNVCNEINTKGFYVQRSSTFNNWTDIGFVASKGMSKACNDYSFTDTKPSTGNNLYRLKQVDEDGKLSYSKSVNIIFETSSITILPNPAINILNITGLTGNTDLKIVNAAGKTVASTTASFSYNWNIQTLPTGNYFLVATQNNQIVASIKFIKQ